jgi:hypothetical protein
MKKYVFLIAILCIGFAIYEIQAGDPVSRSLTFLDKSGSEHVLDKSTAKKLLSDWDKLPKNSLANPACSCTNWMASPSADFPDAYYRICGRFPSPPDCVEFRECYYCVTYPPGGCQCGSGI